MAEGTTIVVTTWTPTSDPVLYFTLETNDWDSG
jgi:hypothetical protein